MSLVTARSTDATARVSTAEGPHSDAVIAEIGSVVLRHEQDVEFDFERV